MKKRDKRWYYLFTMPAVLPFLIVVVIPFFMGIYLSFFEWDGIAKNEKVFVGLSNYARLMQDSDFFKSGGTTLIFTLISVVLINVIAIALALWVTKRLRVSNISRTFLFAPNLIGGLILGFSWKFIFVDVFTYIGKLTGWESVFFNWLSDMHLSLLAIVFASAWSMIGYVMIIYIAGIESIPQSVIEASSIDGATGFKKLKHIIMPLLAPALTTSIFLTLSGSFKVYDVNIALTNGKPAKATAMLSMNIVSEIFDKRHYGYGQAKAIVFFLVIAIIAILQVYFSKKREEKMR